MKEIDLPPMSDADQVRIAASGQLPRWNKRLDPHLREKLRLEMQRIFREATGESMAILIINPKSNLALGEPHE